MNFQITIEEHNGKEQFVLTINNDVVAREDWNKDHPFWGFNISDPSPIEKYLIKRHYNA